MERDITLVVSSCDKYEDTWYPYFELIKKYWPEHPQNIALITETKQYQTPGLNITCYNYPEEYTWSQRLYYTLERISTKYIVFSLEDFFLLDYVKQDRIDECLGWMEANPQIAVCRLCPSDVEELVPTEQYKDFYLAGDNVPFRLETQVALWNRETLMSFIDLAEDPWAFEGLGTERIKGTNKLFLWHFQEDLNDRTNDIFSYRLVGSGYGVSWNFWLWNNRAWFEQNGIYGVKYYRLGQLSEKAFWRRYNHLYTKNPTRLDRMVRPFWRFIIQLRKVWSNLLLFGFRKGIVLSLKQAKH